jgi:hypothetical protein
MAFLRNWATLATGAIQAAKRSTVKKAKSKPARLPGACAEFSSRATSRSALGASHLPSPNRIARSGVPLTPRMCAVHPLPRDGSTTAHASRLSCARRVRYCADADGVDTR